MIFYWSFILNCQYVKLELKLQKYLYMSANYISHVELVDRYSDVWHTEALTTKFPYKRLIFFLCVNVAFSFQFNGEKNLWIEAFNFLNMHNINWNIFRYK